MNSPMGDFLLAGVRESLFCVVSGRASAAPHGPIYFKRRVGFFLLSLCFFLAEVA